MTRKPVTVYQVETFGSALSGIKDEELEEILNRWAEDGWDIINLHAVGDNKVRVIARRVPASPRARRRGWP